MKLVKVFTDIVVFLDIFYNYDKVLLQLKFKKLNILYNKNIVKNLFEVLFSIFFMINSFFMYTYIKYFLEVG